MYLPQEGQQFLKELQSTIKAGGSDGQGEWSYNMYKWPLKDRIIHTRVWREEADTRILLHVINATHSQLSDSLFRCDDTEALAILIYSTAISHVQQL